MSRTSRWVWLAILGSVLLLRFATLGRSPLAPDEAMTAMASLDAANGNGWPLSTSSPLLLNGNALLFLLFGSGDATARWIPALAGVAWVGVAYLWRRRLGEPGSWTAAGLLALSPLTLFAARRVDATLPGALGAVLLLSCLILECDQDGLSHRVRAVLLGVGIGVGLLGGPAFYDVILPGIVAYGFYLWMQRRSLRTLPLSELWRPAVVGLVLAVLAGAVFGLRGSGWSGVFEGLAAWLASWRVTSQPGLESLLVLILYEPATLLFALVGLILAFKDRSPVRLMLAFWAALGVLLISLRPGASALSLVAVSMPLALLAGSAFGELLRLPGPAKPWVGLHTALAAIFWVPALLTAAQYVAGTLSTSPWLIGMGGVVLVALQVLLAFLLTLVLAPHWIWRGALFGVLVIAYVMQIGFATSLAFVRSDTPAEPAVAAAGSADLEALRSTLDDLAVLEEQRRDSFTIALVDHDAEQTALVRWALRDFRSLSVVPSWPATAPKAVITPADADELAPQTEAWVGRQFVAAVTYPDRIPLCPPDTRFLCREIVSWYLYRRVPVPLNPSKVTLWVASSDLP